MRFVTYTESDGDRVDTVTLSVEHLGTQTCRVIESIAVPVGDLRASVGP